MSTRFSNAGLAGVIAAGLLALAACSGAETGETDSAAATSADAAPDAPAAADTAEATSDGGEMADAGGPGDFKETVKPARCKIYDPGGDYEGPCQFTQWGSASFMVNRADNGEFFSGITEVVVEVDAPGVAGGSIRQNGELNPLGTMERHSDDTACWSSADFTVCAY